MNMNKKLLAEQTLNLLDKFASEMPMSFNQFVEATNAENDRNASESFEEWLERILEQFALFRYTDAMKMLQARDIFEAELNKVVDKSISNEGKE